MWGEMRDWVIQQFVFDTFSMHVGECDSLVFEDLHTHPKVFQFLDPQHGVGKVLWKRLFGWRAE